MTPSGQDDDQFLARDLYTIPISSSWFRWDGIHDTERRSLPEFFEGSSFTRNPRVYKEYRDFIISKYREDPSRRLTFTDVRKGLVGDASLLRKVFLFLERWGLINFGAAAAAAAAAVPDGVDLVPGEGEAEAAAAGPNVVVEEGAPWGVQVVPPPPQSYAERKSAGAGAAAAATAVGGENGFRLPPLTSYSDVFGEWMPRKAPFCGFCGEQCSAGQHDLMEGGFIVCSRCSKSKNIRKEETVLLSDHKDGGVNGAASAWTDAETLLLLEAALKHGDDWDLIAQHVRTKSKSDCIARLIQLPFGEHMLGTMNGKCDSRTSISRPNDLKANQNSVTELSKEPIQSLTSTQTDGKENVTDESTEERPLKRRCFPSSLDATDSLMNQVALLSTVVGPHVAAAAADAAVTTLCKENTRAKDALDVNEETINKILFSSNCGHCSDLTVGDQDMKMPERAEREMDKSFGAAAYRMRAAIATAMGAAAARAKLLAEHEEREMQLLMASIIEAQLRKIQYKMKHFEELEHIMEQEYALIQHVKESVHEEWVNLLQQAFRAGIPRLRDHHVFPKLFLNKKHV